MHKSEFHQILLKKIQSVVLAESDLIANMANVCAILHEELNHHWIGFYRTLNNQELILGPFQGPLACTRIEFGKGVCGQSAQTQKTIRVANVHEFKGHIACSSKSNSEIVVPCVYEGHVQFVLDVDSVHFNQFDEMDQSFLEDVVETLAKQHFKKI